MTSPASGTPIADAMNAVLDRLEADIQRLERERAALKEALQDLLKAEDEYGDPLNVAVNEKYEAAVRALASLKD